MHDDNNRACHAPAGRAGAPRVALLAVLALTGVVVLWELWLAPAREGGSWLALKALPLALAVPGLVKGRLYTWQWLSLVLPFFIAEGIVRGWSEPGRVRLLASAELVLALIAFVALLRAVRQRRVARMAASS